MRCECKYPRGGGYTMHMLLGIPVVKCDVYFKLLAKSPNLSPSYFFPLYYSIVHKHYDDVLQASSAHS